MFKKTKKLIPEKTIYLFVFLLMLFVVVVAGHYANTNILYGYLAKSLPPLNNGNRPSAGGLMLGNKPSVDYSSLCIQDKAVNTLVFVDDNSYAIPDSEIKDTFQYANEFLYPMTCARFNILKIWHVHITSDAQINTLMDSILAANPSVVQQTNYVTFFTHRAVNQDVCWNNACAINVLPKNNPINISNYCNTFATDAVDYPNFKTNNLYASIINWKPIWGNCGYDENGNHVSDISFGGQCKNQPGTACVYNNSLGYYLCDGSQNDYLVSDPRLLRVHDIIHEFMHHFGHSVDGAFDHTVGSQACVDAFNATQYTFHYQCPAKAGLDNCFFTICQYAWVNFIHAPNLCN